MASAYFSVRDEHLRVTLRRSLSPDTVEPQLFKVGQVRELSEWLKDNDVSHATFSSSCNWPEDGGLPDVDIHGWIEAAFKIIADENKLIAQKELRDKMGKILDEHLNAHPKIIEAIVDDLMELTVVA